MADPTDLSYGARSGFTAAERSVTGRLSIVGRPQARPATEMRAATMRLPLVPHAPTSPRDHRGAPPAPRKAFAAVRATPPAGVPTETTRIAIERRAAPVTPGHRTTRLPRVGVAGEDRPRVPAIAPGDIVVPRAPARFWDERIQTWTVSVLPGEVYVTDLDECVTTVLGSCVSTCVRHPRTGAGGMNHLVLPDTRRLVRTLGCDGLVSLDRLIDGVLSYGGRAQELEVKMFGGGRVIAASTDVGQLNIAAVRGYFASRGLPIAISDVGGGVARRLRFEPRSGRVLIQRTVMRDTGPL